MLFFNTTYLLRSFTISVTFKSNFLASFWDYMTGGWLLCGMVSACIMRTYSCIFLSTRILIKTCQGNFMDFVQKALAKVIFKDSTAQYVFDYRGRKLFFFHILIMFLKHIYVDWKFNGTLKLLSFVLKHIFMYLTDFIQVA